MKNLILNFQHLATNVKFFMNYIYKIICKYSWFWLIFVNIQTSNANKKIVPMYSDNFLITIRITYEQLCIKFSSILIGPKKLKWHFKKKKFRLIAQKKAKYFEN